MASLSFLINLFHFAILLILMPNISLAHLTHSKDDRVALFIFGDSLFDAGNNNYINTTTSAQANFLPYGETFFKYPTGRFSNGRLIPDFIAEYAKLPLLPPYLQPGSNQQFTNGVNFASAGAGALVQTNQGMVIDLKTQLIYFKNVVKLLEQQQLGDQKEAKKILSRAVYLFSFGNNDYGVPILTNSSIFQLYSHKDYVEMVIGNLTAVVKEVYKSGGRKFGFLSVGPLGWTPTMRAIFNPANTAEVTSLAKLHNFALSRALKRLERQLNGFKYSYFDFYNSALKIIENPSEYGFKDGKSACCGSGPNRGLNSCGGKRGLKEYELCSDPSEYVFFDNAHPSETANQQLSQEMWSGAPNVVSPHNLKALFEQKQA